MRHDDQGYAATVQSPGWLIAEPLDPAIGQQIADFNLRGLRQQLAPGPAAAPAARTAAQGDVLQELSPLWQQLDGPALQRVASMPFLLFELGLDSLPLFARGQASAPVGPPAAAQEFASQVLGYAWHLARANPLGAALRFGMPPGSAAALRELPFGDLQACAMPAASCLRLRWSQRPSVWRRLLVAARCDDREALEQEQLAGLRRLAGELMVITATGGAGRVAEPLW